MSDFNRTCRHKTGYNSWCKDCCSKWYREYHKKPEIKRKYNDANNRYRKTSKAKKKAKILRKTTYRKNKTKAVAYKGGKCSRCGYDKCVASLEFHHTDPNEKEAQVSKYFCFSWKKIKIELDKCVLLCSNCHNELHYRK